jgi:hypothetical protein
MSKSMKIQKQSINKLLEEDLYIRKSLSLKRLLEANASRNMIMRIYRKQKDDFYKKASISKDNSNKKNNRYNNNTNLSNSQNLKELNESIIQLFHKTYYLQNKAKKNFEQKKETNDLFSKRLNNMKKFEKEKEKMVIKPNNSDIKFNQSFDIFKDLLKKYKERDGILYKKDLFKKDVFQETPVVSNDQDNIKKFYIYNYNKYVKKSNLNNDNNKSKQKIKKKSKKKTKNQNEIKKINFDNLTLTNFYKKLFFISQEKIYHMQDKEFNPDKYKFHLKNEENKEINNKKEIPKLKKDIKNLNSLYNSMQNLKLININKKLFENYNTPKNTSKNIFEKKFIINKPYEKMNDSTNSAKREINFPNKRSQINNLRNVKILSARSKEGYELFETKNKFYNKNQYKEEKSVMSQKTKTTFYSIKNKKEKICPLTPRNEIKKSIDLNNEEISESKDAYEELKSVSIKNKNLLLAKIEQFLENKGYNVDRIKNAIKKEQLFNSFNKMRNLIDNYQCKPKVSELYSSIGQKLSENTFMNLNEINQMDKEIYSAEFYYYVSLLKC